MTAAASVGERPADQGIRPFDGRTDLGPLADLIEKVFSDHLDPAGAQMIRGMRLLSKVGWLGWLLSRWLLPPAANPLGFIWEENGRLVGNASLMPVSGFNWRWVVANVAVLPEMRRRGIASELVGASIGSARLAGARQLILQVDLENEGAQNLYKRFGFRVLSRRTTWLRQQGMPLNLGSLTPQADLGAPAEWQEQYALARRLYPEGVIWPYPITPGLFRHSGPGAWFSGGDNQNWVMREAGKLSGSLSLRRGAVPGGMRCVLLVDPPSDAQTVAGLLIHAFRQGLSLDRSYWVDYPVGEAVEALDALGFEPQRDLVWMGLDLTPSNPRGRAS